MSVTRRTVLGGVGALATAATGLTKACADDAVRVNLRLLETSDLHMFVMDWDYYRVKEDPTVGFAKVASLIRAARAEKQNVLLFDNGDFLQGNPLADYVAEKERPKDGLPHPIVGIMNSLGYDAVGLGNHEFNYGLPFLEASLAGANFPFVCANVIRTGGAEFLPPHKVLTRTVKDEAGKDYTLRIGVIGFVPPQIMTWDKAHLAGKVETSDIIIAAKRFVPELRAQCDILVALCHSGIRVGEWVEGGENSALHLAAVPGIDVIFTGHSHRVFPGKDYAGLEGVDAVNGRLLGVPAVMPGFWGSHLGVVDFTLRRDGNRWAVEKADVEARPIYRRSQNKVEPLAERDGAVVAAIAAAHRSTVTWVEQPVGAVDAPVHSYFVWAGFDPASALVNAAQTWYARPLLAATPYASLPLLSSVAPFRAGYTPDSFVDIARGPAAMREAADLYLYSNNTVVAVKVTGAEVLEWLEFGARAFNTIDPAQPGPHPLLDKRFPSYNFDIISGITYGIDISKPPRYDGKGPANTGVRRIVDLRYNGVPIDPNQDFVVITNNYRADGGGNFPGLSAAKIVLRAPDSNRDAVLSYFRSRPTVEVPKAFPWHFAPLARPTQVYFDSGVAAPKLMNDVPGLKVAGTGDPGYVRVELTLL
jgi:2',3'-cyclic-nucleotide 2'-phosphodiesterase / 3'-nucleotidase